MGRKGGLQQTPPTHTTVHCFRTVLNVWKLLQDKDHDQTTTRFTLKEASYPCVLRQFDFPLMTRRGLSSAVASRSSGLRIFLPHGPTSSSPCWAPICLLSILPPWTEPLEKKKKKEGRREGRKKWASREQGTNLEWKSQFPSPGWAGCCWQSRTCSAPNGPWWSQPWWPERARLHSQCKTLPGGAWSHHEGPSTQLGALGTTLQIHTPARCLHPRGPSFQ